MEDKLKDFLLEQDYIRVKLKLTKTNHFEIKASINGVKGLFILDTGASSSCVGFEATEKFQLKKVIMKYHLLMNTLTNLFILI